MWPVDQIRSRTHDRRYNAALIVLLGASMFEHLDATQKARVEAEVNDNFNRTDNPAVAWNQVAEWDLISAFRAAAMDRLGLEPCVSGLSWSQLFAPWRLWRNVHVWTTRAFDSRAATLIHDFHPFDAATVEATEFLCNSGIHVPDKLSTSTRATPDGLLGA